MTITATELSLLVDQIYETALRPEVWPEVMHNTARLLSSSVGVLLSQDIQTRASSFAAVSPETPPELLFDYEAYYGRRDRMRNAVLESPDTVQVEETLLSPAELARDEVYNDCYLRWGLGYAIGWSLRTDPFEASVVFGRARLDGPFTTEAMKLCRMLVPHFGRAVAIRTRLGALEGLNDAAFVAMERVKQGVIFFDRNRKVVFMNETARAMVDAAGGFACSRNELLATIPREARLLEGLIASACAGGEPRSSVAGGRITISRPDGKAPYSVLVSPLRRLPGSLGAAPAAVAIISDPAAPMGDSAPLVGYCGLTRSEAGVATALCAGRSLKEIAEDRGITIATARTFLKHMLEKTATSRQGELVALLLRGPLAFGGEEKPTNQS